MRFFVVGSVLLLASAGAADDLVPEIVTSYERPAATRVFTGDAEYVVCGWKCLTTTSGELSQLTCTKRRTEITFELGTFSYNKHEFTLKRNYCTSKVTFESK